LKNHKGIK